MSIYVRYAKQLLREQTKKGVIEAFLFLLCTIFFQSSQTLATRYKFVFFCENQYFFAIYHFLTFFA